MNFSTKIQEWGKKNPLLTLLLISLIVRIFYLTLNHPLWWDSHVYIGMGKYLFSQGKIGIWETFRPLIHPLIIGSFWNLGFDPIFTGKIIDLFLSLVAVFLTYLLGKKIFDEKTALIGAGIFSLTPLFVMFTGLILTEPLAISLGLLGLLIIFKKESIFAFLCGGILLSLSFLTKFPQGIIFGAVTIALLFKKERIMLKIKLLSSLTCGFIIPLIPYFILNHQLYGNLLEPLLLGNWIVTTAGWLYGSGIFYYLTHFFLTLPIYLFFFVYLYYFIREKQYPSNEKTTLLLIVILTITYFEYVPRKETRYLVTILPFLGLMAASAIIKIYERIKESKTKIIKPRAYVILCTLLIIIYIPTAIYFEPAPDFQHEIKEVIANHNINGLIISSDPSFVSFLDNPLKILSGMEFAQQIYDTNKKDYQLLFVNTCDLICAPEDSSCFSQRTLLLQHFAIENTEVFKTQHQFKKKICVYIIYLPITNNETAEKENLKK